MCGHFGICCAGVERCEEMTVQSMTECLKGSGEEIVSLGRMWSTGLVYFSEEHGAGQANPGSSLASLNLGQPHFPHL